MAHATTKCLKPVKGRRLRATRLDGCGRAVYGDDSQVVSKGFMQVQYTANTSTSDDITVENANGDQCVNEPGKTTLNGYGLEVQFCDVDPGLLSLMTGQDVVLSEDGNTILGFDVDTAIDMADSGFALEVWTGTASTQSCDTGSSQGSFGYLLNPFAQGGVLGDFTVQNGAISFTLTGATTLDGNSWGEGPYNIRFDASDSPAKLPTAVSSTTALRVIVVDMAPPEPACGLRPLMDPTETPLTAVTGTPTGLTVSFDVTPTAPAAPVWYDFGDGTWDYLAAAAAGSTTHTYDKAGTYTVKATTNGEWVSTSVTVTTP